MIQTDIKTIGNIVKFCVRTTKGDTFVMTLDKQAAKDIGYELVHASETLEPMTEESTTAPIVQKDKTSTSYDAFLNDIRELISSIK